MLDLLENHQTSKQVIDLDTANMSQSLTPLSLTSRNKIIKTKEHSSVNKTCNIYI